MRVSRAADKLQRRVRTDPCTPGRWIVDFPQGGRVVMAETVRRNGRINEISTSSNGVRGPAGVRSGMRISEAARRLERAGHPVSHRAFWNEAYDVWMRWTYARGDRGRVLLLRRVSGRVAIMSSFVDMRLARWQMKAPGGC